jgi:hypothetical protein
MKQRNKEKTFNPLLYMTEMCRKAARELRVMLIPPGEYYMLNHHKGNPILNAP